MVNAFRLLLLFRSARIFCLMQMKWNNISNENVKRAWCTCRWSAEQSTHTQQDQKWVRRKFSKLWTVKWLMMSGCEMAKLVHIIFFGDAWCWAANASDQKWNFGGYFSGIEENNDIQLSANRTYLQNIWIAWDTKEQSIFDEYKTIQWFSEQ